MAKVNTNHTNGGVFRGVHIFRNLFPLIDQFAVRVEFNEHMKNVMVWEVLNIGSEEGKVITDWISGEILDAAELASRIVCEV